MIDSYIIHNLLSPSDIFLGHIEHHYGIDFVYIENRLRFCTYDHNNIFNNMLKFGTKTNIVDAIGRIFRNDN